MENLINKLKELATKKVGPLAVWQWLALAVAAWYFLVGRKNMGGGTPGRFRRAATRARAWAGSRFSGARRVYSRARSYARKSYAGRTYRRAKAYATRGRSYVNRARSWSRAKFTRR